MTWDTRSNTSPLETIQLAPAPENLPEGFAPPFGGRCLDYHTGVPTKYMVGTVEGLVMSVNRKASDPSTRISGVFPGHYGPVYAVRRHPTDTKYFASVSDWCCRFFTEDNKTPLLTIPAQRNYLTNAVWGLSRTTVVYTGSTVGTIDAWDLIQSLREPVTSISVGNNPIYSMAIENTGQFLLTGDSEGTATLLELNEPLRNITQTEKSLFNGMMGREAKRVKNYDQFIKEQKMREKQKANSHMEEGEKKEEKPFDPEEIEREFEAALRGEKETVVEKKRVVIGEEEGPPPETKPVVVEPEGEEEEEAKNEEEDGEKGNLESHISGIAHGMLGGESNKGEEEESKERAAPGEGESDSPKLEGKGLDIVADAVADGAEDAADEAEADKAAEEDKKESEKGGEEEKKESETGGEEDKKESETGGDEDKKEEGGALEATLANATGGLLETGGEEEKKEVEADSPKLEGAGLGLVAGAVADDADKAADEAEAEKAAEAEEEKKESDTAAEEDKKESEAGGEEEKKESEAESPQLEGGGLGLIAGAVADGADKAADDAEAEQEKKESEKEPEPEAQERAVDQEPAAEADSPKLEGAGLGLVAGALADGADKAADEAEADKAAEEEKKEGEKEGEEDKKESETGGEEDKKESEKGGEEEKKESEKGGEEDKKEEGGALEATLANAAGGLLG
ncbi:intermediate dynein chain [Tritrichomonas foetus]|uniref:Intermediate dynein chain n=1 Tax=Tritrichomonas foetus TaxID=1144522 RepID=A0A1J4J8I8_9EUKA|nr:intermediate dynein chain [Tritrichomonas foetus]|eukprot:OHS93548.1 intermediate dynein chain [Tritrichomonas foetus]